MLINTFNYHKNNTTFKQISLNDAEIMASSMLVQKIKQEKTSRIREKLELELLKIFDEQIRKEASEKVNRIYSMKDILQELYFIFFEILKSSNAENVDVVKNIVRAISQFKPGQKELKTIYNTREITKSLDYSNNDYPPMKDRISNEQRLTYSSVPDNERIEKFKDRLAATLNDTTNIKQTDKKVVELKGAGVKTRKIAEDLQITEAYANRAHRRGMRAIQKNNDVLPKEYYERAEFMRKTFEIDVSPDELTDFFIDLGFLPDEDYILNANNKINNLTNKLKISKDVYLKSMLKNSALICIDEENFDKKMSDKAGALGVTLQKCAQTISKDNSLLLIKTETLNDKLEKFSKILNLDKKAVQKIFLKYPQLSYYSEETFKNKIKDIAEVMGVSKEDFIKMAVKKPEVFCLKAENVKNKLDDLEKLLNLSREEIVKIALAQPMMLCVKPETVLSKIKAHAKSLNISVQEFERLLVIYPSLLYSSTESVLYKHEILAYYDKMRDKKTKGLHITMISAESIYSCILKYLMFGKVGKHKNYTKEIVNYIKSNPHQKFEYIIPDGKVAEGFLDYVKRISKEYLNEEIIKIKVNPAKSIKVKNL